MLWGYLRALHSLSGIQGEILYWFQNDYFRVIFHHFCKHLWQYQKIGKRLKAKVFSNPSLWKARNLDGDKVVLLLQGVEQV